MDSKKERIQRLEKAVDRMMKINQAFRESGNDIDKMDIQLSDRQRKALKKLYRLHAFRGPDRPLIQFFYIRVIVSKIVRLKQI